MDNSAVVAHEEIFGPVLVVVPYDDVDQAVAIARRMRTGTVGVNFYNIDLGAPFGGVKAGGLGRELAPTGLTAYVEDKSVRPRR